MKSLRIAALSAVTLTLVAACSSDDDAAQITPPDVELTVPDDVTIPDDASEVTLPDGSLPEVAQECQEYFSEFGKALTGTADEGTLDDLADAVPDDLRDAADTFVDATREVADVMREHNGDITNDEVRAALTDLAQDDEFTQAQQDLQAWVEDGCPA